LVIIILGKPFSSSFSSIIIKALVFTPGFLLPQQAFLLHCRKSLQRTHGEVGQGKALTHHKHQRENAGCAETRKKSCPGSPLKVNPTFSSSKFAPNPAFSLQE
jgi:hypothetical protein